MAEIPVLSWDGEDRGTATIEGNKITITYDENRMDEVMPAISSGRIIGIILNFRVQHDIPMPGDIDGS